MPCGIYKIINKVNNNFYIGSTKNSSVRFYRHRNDLRNNRHDNARLQNAWNLYGEENFIFIIETECDPSMLVCEEQKRLNEFYGKEYCYNLSPSADRPNLGIPRSPETKTKISIATRGKSKFSIEQKEKMSRDRLGKTHTEETKLKMRGRESSVDNISKAHLANTGRIYTDAHRKNISEAHRKLNRTLTEEQRIKVRIGVKKAVLEGRYKKNKIPENERENIKDLYLYKKMNKRQLAIRYQVTPSSMGKYLKKMGL
jgi:group I intron endonuclease